MVRLRWLRWALRWAIGVVLLGLLPFGAMAAPENPADVAAARELFKQGVQASKAGNWEEAAEKLARSVALKPAPIARYSLGVAQHKTGRLVEALENLRAFLASPSEEATDAYREPAQAAVAELEPRVGRVSINVSPAGLDGLTVHVDADTVPTIALDQPRLVNPGKHEVKAVAPGYHEAKQSFQVSEGGSAAVELVLVPGPKPGESAAKADEQATASTKPEQPEAVESSFPTGPVVLIVGGAAVFGAGLVVGLLGLSEAKDAPSSEGEEADSARTKGLAGDIVAGAGIAAAAAGLIWLIAYDGTPEPAAEAEPEVGSVRPWSQGGVAGLQLWF